MKAICLKNIDIEGSDVRQACVNLRILVVPWLDWSIEYSRTTSERVMVVTRLQSGESTMIIR